MDRSKSFAHNTNSDRLHKLYSSLSYPLRLYQFLGCVPFTFSKNGIEKSILRYLFTAIQNSIYFAFFLWVEYGNFSRHPLSLELHALFTIIIISVTIITNWIEAAATSEKWARLFGELLAIDKQLTKYNVRMEYTSGLKKSFTILAGQLLLPTIVYLLFDGSASYQLVIIVYLIPHCIICMTGYLYCEMVILITERFKILNNILGTLIHSDSNLIFTSSNNTGEKSFDVLCQVCTWHLELVKSIAILNETFGFRMVVHFIYSFLLLAIHIFLICRDLKMELSFQPVSDYMALISCIGYSVYRICKLCENSVQEAKKPGSLIHQIKTNDQDMIDEIEMFSIQMINEEVEFSAAGFFTINYGLLFSMIGGVTTYTIILIQLQDSDTYPVGTTTEDMITTNI